MNWKNNLHEVLKHRLDKSENYRDEYLRVLEEVINPALKEIQKFLLNYHVDLKIDPNQPKIIVPLYGGGMNLFGMDFKQEDNLVIIEIKQYDLLPLIEDSQPIKRVEKEIVAFKDLTNDSVGELFFKYFQEYKEYFKMGNY